MEPLYIILILKQNQPSLTNRQYSRDYWDVFYVLFVIILISSIKVSISIRSQKNFIKACNLNYLSSNSLKQIVKKGKLDGEKE